MESQTAGLGCLGFDRWDTRAAPRRWSLGFDHRCSRPALRQGRARAVAGGPRTADRLEL